jgi:excisionase family DNA binding protein
MGTKAELRKAIVEGNQTLVESLFDEGFSVDDRLLHDWTPLHVAAKAEQLALATWLISKGAEVNAETPLWQTPLDLVQNKQMVALLRKHGGKRGVELSLHAAVFHGDMPSAKKHLESGSNPNLIRNGQLAICVALRRRRFAEAKFLLRKHVSVTDAERDGETALHAALRSNADLEMLKQIVALGADVNGGDAQYGTPVKIAAGRWMRPRQMRYEENKKALEFLIAHGAKLPTEEEGEDSLVQIALSEDNPKLAHWLIDQGVRATIHQAAEAGHALQVQEHLRRGVDVDTPGTWAHRTPLFLAVTSGHLDIAELLLHSGADPNIAGYGGDTALHQAVEAEATDLVRLLMAHGADPDTKNTSGKSPRQLAEHRNCPHLLRLMDVPVTTQNANNLGQGNLVAQVQQFFTVEKVAELLSVDIAFVMALIRDKKLKTVKMNPETVRIPAESLSQYLSTLSESGS